MTATTSTALVPPARARLLYSPRAWRQWFRFKSDAIRQRQAERNLAAVGPHVPAGARVLDVGAGDGRLARLLRERRGCDVLAVDVAPGCQTDVAFQVYDGVTLPVADRSQDVVLLLYVLHHAADDAAVLAEARRVLAPGGRLLVAEDQVETRRQRLVTIGFHVWLWTFTFMGWRGQFRRVDAWRARFAAAGLTTEQVVDLGAQGRLWPRNILFVTRPS